MKPKCVRASSVTFGMIYPNQFAKGQHVLWMKGASGCPVHVIEGLVVGVSNSRVRVLQMSGEEVSVRPEKLLVLGEVES